MDLGYWYQNVSTLDFIGAKSDVGGGKNWCYETYKAPVKTSPPTNQHPVILQATSHPLPVAQPTVSNRDAPITHWPIIGRPIIGAKQSADYRPITD